MKRFLASLLCCAVLPLAAADLNEPTAQEKAEGWRSLFNGRDLTGWHNFKKTTAPTKGWVARDGLLVHTDKGGGGDLISQEVYDQFDLRWDWKIAPKANSGLKYFVTSERTSALGHEYQLIDDSGHADAHAAGGKRVTASFYDVLAPAKTELKPVGEWSSSRVLVQGNHVEHWLNGKKVLEYELGSEAVKAAVAKSKFKNVPEFGTRLKGHILLQDHGDEIAFRNLRIRPLGEK